jgi:hypothetical protein
MPINHKLFYGLFACLNVCVSNIIMADIVEVAGNSILMEKCALITRDQDLLQLKINWRISLSHDFPFHNIKPMSKNR